VYSRSMNASANLTESGFYITTYVRGIMKIFKSYDTKAHTKEAGDLSISVKTCHKSLLYKDFTLQMDTGPLFYTIFKMKELKGDGWKRTPVSGMLFYGQGDSAWVSPSLKPGNQEDSSDEEE